MKLSKHLHSCFLVEDQDTTFLFDPGIFSYQEKALDITKLEKLDYILITHEHPDHMHVPFVKELVEKFPTVKIITTQSAVDILKKENISAINEGDDTVTIETVPHEDLPDLTKPPENALITVLGKIASPGDSHHFSTTVDVLALPIGAPWGSTTDAVKLALTLKPKVIIPVHDWMWKDVIRQGMYQRLLGFFKEKGIAFKALETGEEIDV